MSRCLGTFFGILLMTLVSTQAQDVSIIAHRGNSSEAPENTLASFKQAIELGVDFIEFDVHLTQDGIPVVIHDPFIDRTTNYHSRTMISDMKMAELKKLDAGSWFHTLYSGEKIPTLVEVLELPLGNTKLMLEIKHESASPEQLAFSVAQILKRSPKRSQVFIGSMCPKILNHIRRHLPDQTIIAIIEDIDQLPNHHENDPDIYAYKHTFISEELVEELKEKGKLLWAWTVNEIADMQALVQLQIDGLISNYPKLALEGQD